MESIIKIAEKQDEQKYPCLKQTIEKGVVVLFTTANTGTVVHIPHSGSIFKLGEVFTDFVENMFAPFNGEITLKN